MTSIDEAVSHPLQRRTVLTLIGSQALGAVGMSAGVAVGSLLAADLSGSETWAGLGSTAQVLGGALAAGVLARVMTARGRRPGVVLGYAIAVLGAGLILAAALVGSFALLLLGSLLFGAATAANSQARFAATDLASDRHRGRDLSLVVWATTIGAVAGPNLTGLGADVSRVLGLPALAGPFALSAVGFALAGLLLAVALRPDPLLTARAEQDPHDEGGDAPRGLAAGVAAIRTRPDALLGVGTVALGHTVMVSVMVMTPLHMRHGHAELEVIGLVLSLHIAGMFAFSPLTGWAVDRLGGRVVATVGALVLATAALLAGLADSGASGTLTFALILLGVGWSCTLVAGSTLLTAATPLRLRPSTQGVADVAMGLAGGGGGALAGVVVHHLGYPTLAIGAAALALAGLLAGVVYSRRATPRDAVGDA